jgi:hypothetical protein
MSLSKTGGPQSRWLDCATRDQVEMIVDGQRGEGELCSNVAWHGIVNCNQGMRTSPKTCESAKNC